MVDRVKTSGPEHQVFALIVLHVMTLVCSSAAFPATTPDSRFVLQTERLIKAGFQGQGVRVGVISNGAADFDELRRRNILPEVAFVKGVQGNGDEGDWMMQVVHHLAPEAKLGFCAAADAAETVDCARSMISEFGANVIVDDINPPPVYEYWTKKAAGLSALKRTHSDVLFFTGAGNNGGTYYEALWRPARVTINNVDYVAHDFGGAMNEPSDTLESVVLPPMSKVRFFVGTDADPRETKDGCNPSNTELILALLDERGSIVAKTASRCPVLALSANNGARRQVEVRLAVLSPAGNDSAVRALKLVAIQQDGAAAVSLRYRSAGGAGNSAAVSGLMAVSSVDPNSGWQNRYAVEAFANTGPQCIRYTQDDPEHFRHLAQPECFEQPIFVVPDRQDVMKREGADLAMRPFVGNSAAGPAAAAIAALLLSASVNPSRIPELLKDTAARQTERTGWDPHFGYGLLDADAAGVGAHVLPARETSARAQSGHGTQPNDPSRVAAADALSQKAQKGDAAALRALDAQARAGVTEAQALLAMTDHEAGDDDGAARWALAGAEQGEIAAQTFLGTLYNRGWGVPQDVLAAQAWWLRAARAGNAMAMFNLGITMAYQREVPPAPTFGLALMIAAESRGFHREGLREDLAELENILSPWQQKEAHSLALRVAASPMSIEVP